MTRSLFARGWPTLMTLAALTMSALSAEAAPPTQRPSDATLRYAIERLEVVGNQSTTEAVVLSFVPFKPGDTLRVSDPEIELTRLRLLATGYFSEVHLSLARGERRGNIVLTIRVVERNTLVIDHVAMGIAADEDSEGRSQPLSPYFGVGVAENNLAGRGMRLNAGVAVAADQWALQTGFFLPRIAASKWSFDASLHYIDGRDFFGTREVSFESPQLVQRSVTDYAVVDYRRFGGAVAAGYDLTLRTRLGFGYHLEKVDAVVPTVASHLRGDTREPIAFDILPGESVLSTVFASLDYDSRNRPFLPTDGWQASLRLNLGLAPFGSSYGYQKIEGRAQRWWKMPWGHVVSAEALLGMVHGSAPFFERFYVGDYTEALPGRVMGLNPDRRQPPNIFNTAIEQVRYGDYAARLAAEYRVPLYEGRQSIFGIDLFGRAGVYGVAAHRDLVDPVDTHRGASRVPLDLTYNLGLRIETEIGGFSLALSNLLGLLPARGSERK